MDYEYDTGKVYATPTSDNEVNYTIVTPAAWDYIVWEDEYDQLVRNSSFFIFGTLAARNKTSASTLFRLLEIAPFKVFDVNLRAGHFKKETISDLLTIADVVKLNHYELEFMTGWFGFATIEERLKCISERFSIPTVIVTAGAEGAMLLSDGKIEKTAGIKVKVEDAVGSGDAFLAGYLSKLMDNAEPGEALHYANTLAAFIATQRGGCPEYETDQLTTISELLKHEN